MLGVVKAITAKLWDLNMKYLKYKDYNQYVESQVRANHIKINSNYVDANTIFKIVESLPDKSFISNVICHGVRSGIECRFISECMERFGQKVDIVGTELSEECVEKFKNNYNKNIELVTWDMNNRNDDWVNKFDMLYSNSLDHVFDINKTLTHWGEQVKIGGYICVEWDSTDGSYVTSSDPYTASHEEIRFLIEKHCSAVHLETVKRVNQRFKIFLEPDDEPHEEFLCHAPSLTSIYKRI
jgi:hypothetical protein